MEASDVVRAHGGATRWKVLQATVGRRALRRAVQDGHILHRDGVYFLPPADRPVLLATQLRGVRCHRSAAQHWGFALPPLQPGEALRHDIAIPPKAARRNRPADVRLRYLELDPSDVLADVLTAVATAAFCLRDLSLREALSVGDSALASGGVTLEALTAHVRGFRGPRRTIALRRLAMLDARAANAFESSCRAILIEAGIEGFVVQYPVRHKGRWLARVDLAHPLLRIVIECDGFETHGTRDAMVADSLRHTRLASAGWRTLRFTWQQVMFHPDWVVEQVRDTVSHVMVPAPAA
jgi:very-short-patch-repair endonuclease